MADMWFKRHLNWTWFLTWMFSNIILISIGILYIELYIVLVIGCCVVYYGITLWVLNEKGRNLLWSFVPISAVLLDNKKSYSIHSALKIWTMNGIYKTLEVDCSVQELQEILSCPTCAFFNGGEQLWCNAPDAPNIDGKYCNTFIAKTAD